jgi:hypothetical protein
MNLWPIAIAVAFILLISYGRPAATWLYERSKRLRLPSLPSLPLGAQIPVWQALLIVVAVWASMGGLQYQGCMLPQFKLPWSIIAPKVTAVTYVHEQRVNEVPPPVRAGLSKLNEQGITATVFDVDTIDKQGGEVPEQYKVPLAAAKKRPSLVVTGGSTVIRVVENPQTEAETTGAAQ